MAELRTTRKKHRETLHMWDQIPQKKIRGTSVLFPYTHLLVYSTNACGVPVHARHYVKALETLWARAHKISGSWGF